MTTVEIEERILSKLRALPASKRKRVLQLVEGLAVAGRAPYRTSRGLWSDLDIPVTDSDIDAARREMWADFPREIEP